MVVPDLASLAETFRQVVFQHGERGKVCVPDEPDNADTAYTVPSVALGPFVLYVLQIATVIATRYKYWVVYYCYITSNCTWSLCVNCNCATSTISNVTTSRYSYPAIQRTTVIYVLYKKTLLVDSSY